MSILVLFAVTIVDQLHSGPGVGIECNRVLGGSSVGLDGIARLLSSGMGDLESTYQLFMSTVLYVLI